MSENVSKSDSGTPAKKLKPDEAVQLLFSLEIKEDRPSIFELNIDCFDEIFDYLSAKDLLALSWTCRTIQQVVGEYAKANYLSAAKFDESDVVHQVFSCDGTEYAETPSFNQFIKHISLNGNQSIRYIERYASTFTSVSHLSLEAVELTPHRLHCMQHILNTLEIVELKHCSLKCSFYESCLKNCANLKRLYVSCSNEDIVQASENDWLLTEYSKLEHLGLIPRRRLRFNMNELSRFFELNPKVRSFSTSYRFLWEHQVEFAEKTIQLDALDVIVHQKFGMIVHIESIFKLLNELYDRGFYKKLHLRVPEINEQYTNRMVSLQGLEKLFINFLDRNYGLPLVGNLKELTIMHATPRVDMDILAQRLTNLERVCLGTSIYGDVLAFVRYASKLSTIILKCQNEALNQSAYRNELIFNASALNEERKKLKNARKVTIYVPDDVFVSFKWATTNGDMDGKCVRIKRSDSYRF
ncbi:uncharacterized protein LOC129568838 isoform X1 [Sitodiplosis mosellana]|uniref:uncharacterized protein LOC129568838 isoform X1 n=1 Tax=Sitodiplosis mosellana TaxID=263140 RepID=UPI0024448E9A|nr:uncharacterized protein LOC129568838 isoform X1 [Sitodiplosis mosellana]XP_055303137.1 uncharacterized protein LOC129568838 isoform X1 [Sitodiplosis mosellana]